MKILSELSSDTMLAIRYKNDELEIVEKDNFLDDKEFHIKRGIKRVSTTIKCFQKFNLFNVLENLDEQIYDDWAFEVYRQIECVIDVEELETKINDIFETYPIYFEDEEIELDI